MKPVSYKQIIIYNLYPFSRINKKKVVWFLNKYLLMPIFLVKSFEIAFKMHK